MKNSLLALAACLIAMVGNAQKTHNPGDFDKVKVYDRISAELIPSSTTKVEIDGTRSDDVEVINRNGELKVRMRTTQLLKGEEITAKIYYVNLEDIQVSEGASIGSSSAVKSYDVKLEVKSGGSINLQVDATEFNATVSTGGSVKVVGKAANGKLSVSTGGAIDAKELRLDRAEAVVKAGGNIAVNAKDKLTARVTTGGSIEVHGKPTKVDKKVTLGGSINIL